MPPNTRGRRRTRFGAVDRMNSEAARAASLTVRSCDAIRLAALPREWCCAISCVRADFGVEHRSASSRGALPH